MEPNISKSLMNFIVLLITIQFSVAKFINFDSNRLNVIAKQLDEKRIDYLGEMDTNYITDNDDYLENSMKMNRLSKRTNINITGGPTVLSVGDSTILKCSSLGSPSPLIYWVRQEELNHFKEMMQRHPKMMNSKVSTSDNIGLTESKYVIDCATKKDEGEIFCISIIDDEILTASVNITVNSSGTGAYKKYCDEFQRPVIVDNLKFLFAEQGGTVSLPCGVRNVLKSNIDWLTRDGQRVIDLYPNAHSQPWNGELVITDISFRNMNEYFCVAVSENGRDEVKTFLYPLLAEKHKD
ncbi:zwei Ig domain protein zig-3 [Chelonus insularis]|uniref:zwei Ig domain protein zig-3 n=1 Tax=Chelonus insularis TaxID=460826 RepID=UPI00158BA02A|nr:zwei Ig domain protein zig-3 [Chelonus insularis]XP_034935849.1 zwei Ig domain protein zig-3 [Chelonus insularis]